MATKMKYNMLVFASVLICTTAPGALAQQYEWAEGLGGTGDDSNRDLALNSQGNVYITGTFQGTNIDFDPGPGTAYLSSAGGLDIFIAKYDSYGNYLWAKHMGGSGNDYGARIAVDAAGNLNVVGWFESTNADFDPGPGTLILSTAGYADVFFARYDVNGNYLWAHRVGGTNYDGCHDITLDSMNNVFVTGYFNGTNIDFDPGPATAYLSSVASSGDIFFAKYDSSGNYLWAEGTGGSSYEVGNAIALDDSGNVYLTGPFSGTNVDFDPGPGTAFLSSAGGFDIFLARYSPSGTYVWARRIGEAGDDIGGDLVVGRSGRLSVTGCFHGANVDFDPGSGTALLSSAGGFDAFFGKYDVSGNYIWAERIGGAVDDYGDKVILDGSENVYVTGSFEGTDIDFDPGPGTALLSSAGGSDAFFARYDPSGAYGWAERLGGAYGDYDGGISLDTFDNVCVGGSFSGTNVDFDPGPGTAYLSSSGGTDIFLSKYSQNSSGTRGDGEKNRPSGLILCQNYPNPFNPSTVIRYCLPQSLFVTLTVYNTLGQQVTRMVNEQQRAGYHEAAFRSNGLATGVYYYHIQAGYFAASRKLVILQ